MITCNNCNWKGHSWECGNWDEDPEHRCQLCERTRVGEVDVQIHECKVCYGPASYKLPSAENQSEIRLIAERTAEETPGRGIIILRMMVNKGWSNISMMDTIANFLILSRDDSLLYMLRVVEDHLDWLYEDAPHWEESQQQVEQEANTEE